jgi:hypothetical protein
VPAHDPEVRQLLSQHAATVKWSKRNPKDPDEAPARARAGLEAKFLREVDPDGVLPEAERNRRAKDVGGRWSSDSHARQEASAYGDGLKTQSAGEVNASAKVGYQGQANRPIQENHIVPSLVRTISASTGPNWPRRGPA